MKKGLSIVILACREEENLRVLIPQILKSAESLDVPFEILVIDTAEPLDHTADVCAEYHCRYVNQRYPRFGGAYRTGIEETENSMFLILDGDGSHNPVYIPQMYSAFVREHCDVVIGSRYVRGGVTRDALSSVILSRILNLVFRAVTGIRAHDISTDYRIYRTDLLKQITITGENFDVVQEILVKMRAANGGRLKIREVPITFEKRRYGESKREWIPFVRSYAKSLLHLLRLRLHS